MFSENIGNDYIVIQEGTSEGTQVKYKKDGYWYKKDNRGACSEILYISICLYASLFFKLLIIYIFI